MLSRLFAAAPTAAGRRTYSFFSSKPPGGGGIVKQQSQSQGNSTNVVKRATPATTPSPTPAATAPKSASPAPATQASATTPSTPLAIAEPKTAPTPSLPPALHPSPVLATMHLHSFFSLDRPMLLLSQPVSRLFETGLPPQLPRAQLTDQDGAGETDADADAARALSHALVMSRVRGAVDWKAALERLGVEASSAADAREEADLAVLMDSVKRKRRKKITKHKYKKRRKLQRSERRRLGK
ncbi:hypothetical protein FRC07_014004 [Ceratobasidium sp. 392]|nr:hypothetical protein FRC07_014004 [Ceratobasidium sp. 392]